MIVAFAFMVGTAFGLFLRWLDQRIEDSLNDWASKKGREHAQRDSPDITSFRAQCRLGHIREVVGDASPDGWAVRASGGYVLDGVVHTTPEREAGYRQILAEEQERMR